MEQQPISTGAAESGAVVGLGPGLRYKCEGCGNLTRFDVRVAERATRFWHVALSGVGQVEETELLEQDIEAVICRWCGSPDRVVTEPAPAAAAGQ
ncbi:hypothetical protein BH23ACT9_BH23ACT9_22900 [soil metagenome]